MVKQKLVAIGAVALITLMTAGSAIAQTASPSPSSSPTASPTASPTVPGGAPSTGMAK